MRKLYLIVANLSSPAAQEALEQRLSTYRSKLTLAPGVWLLAAAGTSAQLHQALTKAISPSETVLVTKIGANMAWNRSGELQAWLSSQLAALT